MAVRVRADGVRALDPPRLAELWGGLLAWPVVELPTGDVDVVPSDSTPFRLRFSRTDEPKREKNSRHPDLTSASPADQDDLVARALAAGARRVDVGQGPDASHVVLADPEGDELCVLEPGNEFLAGCGRLGAIARDGGRRVGLFWRVALGWPSV